MFTPPVYFHRLNDTVPVPKKATFGSAGWDLFSMISGPLAPGHRMLIPTGIKVMIPFGYYGRIAPRSGLSCRGIDIGAGVIDSDFRGEVKVLVINNSQVTLGIDRVNAIAQLIIETLGPNLQEIKEADTFMNLKSYETMRGSAGFGSTDGRTSSNIVSQINQEREGARLFYEQHVHDQYMIKEAEKKAEQRVEELFRSNCNCGINCPTEMIVHATRQSLLKPDAKQHLGLSPEQDLVPEF